MVSCGRITPSVAMCINIAWLSLLLFQQSMVASEETASAKNASCVKNMGSKPEPYITYNDVIGANISCDTHTDGGGWIYIQKRENGTLDFYKTWNEYKSMFGDLRSDFWLGNENIHKLTSSGDWELRIDVTSDGKAYWGHYPRMEVANETQNYTLTLSGNAEGPLVSMDNVGFLCSNGRNFGTKDRNNYYDYHMQFDCPKFAHSGWWHPDLDDGCQNYCTSSNLNGQWGDRNTSGVYWYQSIDFPPPERTYIWRYLQRTSMKIRQKV